MKSIDKFQTSAIKHLNKITGGNNPSNQTSKKSTPPSMDTEADSEPAVEEIEVACESWSMEWV